MLITKAPRGTNDILPEDIPKWLYVEDVIRKLCFEFGYKEIRTPVFEHTELFERGVGDTTDVVQKEMYTFLDKGGRSITLRPEGTASAARAFLEHGLFNQPLPVKLYYNISCYRYEKPQAGRLREFHQFGVEAYGSQSPQMDAEIILLCMTLFKRLGISDLTLKINSIGCKDCRHKYNELLKEYLRDNLDRLCETCNIRFEKNPLRILDCKNKSCNEITEGAPKLLDHICPSCKEHFESTKKYLDELKIAYAIDPWIVRGLDYYTKTVFEVKTGKSGAQSTVCGGGRYDGLIEELGGPQMGGIGFAVGIERLLDLMKDKQIEFPKSRPLDIFIANAGKDADFEAARLVQNLRENGFWAEKDLSEKSLKAQMKYADKLNARFSLVLGDDEIKTGQAVLKNMKTGEKINVSLKVLDMLYKVLKEE